MSNPTQLTYAQKLTALAYKFYHHQAWRPASGDYYTSSRDDLELYQVVEVIPATPERAAEIITRRCDLDNKDSTPDRWSYIDFMHPDGFGSKRVWVPTFVLSPTVGQVKVPEPVVGGYYRDQDGVRWLAGTAAHNHGTGHTAHVMMRRKDGAIHVFDADFWQTGFFSVDPQPFDNPAL